MHSRVPLFIDTPSYARADPEFGKGVVRKSGGRKSPIGVEGQNTDLGAKSPEAGNLLRLSYASNSLLLSRIVILRTIVTDRVA